MGKAVLPTERELKRLQPSGFLVDAVEQFLMAAYASRKPPIIAASVLALIVELDQRGVAFPPRADVAAALQCSVFGIDGAIALALRRELISLKMHVQPGKAASGSTVNKHRYFVPCQQLKATLRFVPVVSYPSSVVQDVRSDRSSVQQ
jgi:hypothetical protein